MAQLEQMVIVYRLAAYPSEPNSIFDKLLDNHDPEFFSYLEAILISILFSPSTISKTNPLVAPRVKR